MSIARRKIVGLIAASAASAATTLAGCGGGDYAPPTGFIRLLNLNPEFPSADFSIDGAVVAGSVPSPGLTPRIEVDYGAYTFALRERSTGITQSFGGVPVDDFSPSQFVFYRHFGSTRLDATPPGIINYFDSSTALDVDLFDDGVGVQVERLAFESGVAQTSPSRGCVLRLYAAGSSTLIYDSGPQQRTDSILIFPRFPASSSRSGEVAVAGLNYRYSSANLVVWPNLLG